MCGHVVVLRSQHIHTMSKGLLGTEGLLMLLVAIVRLHNVLLHTFDLLDAVSTSLEHGVHLGVPTDIIWDEAHCTLILHLTYYLLVGSFVE